MTTNFFHPSLLLRFLDPGSEIWDPGSGKGKKSGSRIRDKHLRSEPLCARKAGAGSPCTACLLFGSAGPAVNICTQVKIDLSARISLDQQLPAPPTLPIGLYFPLLLENSLKGSLTRDFWLQVFFMNQCPPGLQVFRWSHFEFFRKLAKIFAN